MARMAKKSNEAAKGILNKTRGSRLAEEAVFLRSEIGKALGLMFRKKIRGRGLVFVFGREKTISIHNLFVFQSIDCLWLDSRKRVVWARENVRPFTPLVVPKKKARYLIELPSGTIKKSGTREGDIVLF